MPQPPACRFIFMHSYLTEELLRACRNECKMMLAGPLSVCFFPPSKKIFWTSVIWQFGSLVVLQIPCLKRLPRCGKELHGITVFEASDRNINSFALFNKLGTVVELKNSMHLWHFRFHGASATFSTSAKSWRPSFKAAWKEEWFAKLERARIFPCFNSSICGLHLQPCPEAWLSTYTESSMAHIYWIINCYPIHSQLLVVLVSRFLCNIFDKEPYLHVKSPIQHRKHGSWIISFVNPHLFLRRGWLGVLPEAHVRQGHGFRQAHPGGFKELLLSSLKRGACMTQVNRFGENYSYLFDSIHLLLSLIQLPGTFGRFWSTHQVGKSLQLRNFISWPFFHLLSFRSHY